MQLESFHWFNHHGLSERHYNIVKDPPPRALIGQKTMFCPAEYKT